MWQVKIHKLVIEEDFKKIGPEHQTRIIKTVKKKLSLDPYAYGKSLSGEFSGYWRLAVEDYRVVYRIMKEQVIVWVIKVGIRRDSRVYEELFLRLKKLNFSR